MPGCKTHKWVGVATGAAWAAYRANDQPTQHWLAEVIGGAVGGGVGGLLPDVIEPAASSWHRDLAHSFAVGGGVFAVRETLAALGVACRENAQQCRALPMALQGNVFVFVSKDPYQQLVSSLFEYLWRFLAGFVNGLAAGYVSHLALDAATPRSIPLLTSGF